eukprot:SAG31_NODE_43994_length_264_cov_1.739394_1_plen_28_part_10
MSVPLVSTHTNEEKILTHHKCAQSYSQL